MCKHYDAINSHKFYLKLWAGEDINIGIGLHESEHLSVFEACQETVKMMLGMLNPLNAQKNLLDLGSGYGASARYIVQKTGCYVDCINLSERQNLYNIQTNQKLDLTEKIRVMKGNFEDLKQLDTRYEVVWSQDSFLHSKRKEKVLYESSRVLRPGGQFIFSDILQKEGCNASDMTDVLKRFDLPRLATITYYQQVATKVGLKYISFKDLSPHLVAHYSSIISIMEKQWTELSYDFQTDYLEELKNGMETWIERGRAGILKWGVFLLEKV